MFDDRRCDINKNMNIDVAKYIADNEVKQISIYLPKSLLADIDKLVKGCKYSTRNQFVKLALINKIMEENK
jgi:hypothetical protein